jgi:1-acyl-sn-glycerol-3-phosphate acyltransferase
VFIEGTRSRTAEMLPPRPGIGLLAGRARCAVLPAHVSGLNRYRAALLGRVRTEIRFGPLMPAGWSDAFPSSGAGYRQMADHIMGRIRDLRAEAEAAG